MFIFGKGDVIEFHTLKFRRPNQVVAESVSISNVSWVAFPSFAGELTVKYNNEISTTKEETYPYWR